MVVCDGPENQVWLVRPWSKDDTATVSAHNHGRWPLEGIGWVYAREAAHLMGIGDHHRGGHPDPRWQGNIMGEYLGTVDERNITEIINANIAR